MSDRQESDELHDPSVTLPEGWIVTQTGVTHSYMQPTNQSFRTRAHYTEAVFYVCVRSYTIESEETIEFRKPNVPGVHEGAEKALQDCLDRMAET